jgi:hypothetical protein
MKPRELVKLNIKLRLPIYFLSGSLALLIQKRNPITLASGLELYRQLGLIPKWHCPLGNYLLGV